MFWDKPIDMANTPKTLQQKRMMLQQLHKGYRASGLFGLEYFPQAYTHLLAGKGKDRSISRKFMDIYV